MSLLDDVNTDALLERLDVRSVIMLCFIDRDNRRLVLSRVGDVVSYTRSLLHILSDEDALDVCITLDMGDDSKKYMRTMTPGNLCRLGTEMVTLNRPRMLQTIIPQILFASTNKYRDGSSLSSLITELNNGYEWNKSNVYEYFTRIDYILTDVITSGRFYLLPLIRDVEGGEYSARVSRMIARVCLSSNEGIMFLLNNGMLTNKEDLALCLATLNDNDIFDKYKDMLTQPCTCNNWECWKWIEEPLRAAGGNKYISDGIMSRVSGSASEYIMGKIRRLDVAP